MPFPLEPLSQHSTSWLARQADTGLAHHRAVPLDDFAAVLNDVPGVAEPAAAPAWDWAAANQRKKDAVAPLAGALDDLEIRIAELVAITTHLELD